MSIASLRRTAAAHPELLTEQECRLLLEVEALENLAFGRGFDSGFDSGFQIGAAADSLEAVLRGNHELFEAMHGYVSDRDALLAGRATS